MIANVLSLNEITKKYRVTFDSGDENNFMVHIGGTIVKISAIDDGSYIRRTDKIFSKVDE